MASQATTKDEITFVSVAPARTDSYASDNSLSGGSTEKTIFFAPPPRVAVDVPIPADATPTSLPSWLPTLFQPRPLLGIAALGFAACCLFASLGVLVGSSGQPVASWQWQPSVFLAVLSAVSNMATRFALAQAIPIAWWYQASRGDTISRLQKQWESGQGLIKAVRNARTTLWLTVAVVASLLLVVDGPFLQRASNVISISPTVATTLNLKIAPEMPAGFSGAYDESGLWLTNAAQKALNQYMANSTIVADITGCSGECTATVEAPGITVSDCETQTWPITYEDMFNRSASWGPIPGQMPIFTITVAEIDLAPGYSGQEFVALRVGRMNMQNCSGHYSLRTCTIKSAVLNYDVAIQGDTIRFARPAGEATLFALANNSYVNSSETSTPLAFTALAAHMYPLINANASLAPPPGGRQQAGANAINPLSISSMSLPYFQSNGDDCSFSALDPTPDIISDFNNLFFRSGIVTAGSSISDNAMDAGLSIDQIVQAQQTTTINVFHTDLKWFAGAAIVQVIAIVAILPLFWGWWTLGVRVTMSPFEIGNLFGAPLFQGINSAAGSRGVEETMGDVQVKFGTLCDEDEQDLEKGGIPGGYLPRRRQLALARAEGVAHPTVGVVFDC